VSRFHMTNVIRNTILSFQYNKLVDRKVHFLGFCAIRNTRMCMFCRSLFVLLYFFFWPLCCLFFFDTVKVLIFAASNFRGFSQLDKFAGTFFRVFLIAQKPRKCTFRSTSFMNGIFYWPVKRINFIL
jgi:hypothetical protein